MDAATTAWMQEVGRRRMPKPRAAMGQGWPFAAGPWSNDGVREPAAGGPDGGASLFGYFLRGRPSGDCKK